MSQTPEPGTGPQPPSGPDESEPVRDPVHILRDRAAATRRDRDASIQDLRQTMGDEEILDEFGINLDGIES